MTHRRNLITDVPGVLVGHAHDAQAFTGASVVLCPPGMQTTGAVDIRGGGPGTRDTEALSLTGTVSEVHAVVLSGGSALGLSAATGVQTWLAARGVGFEVAGARVPIVPQAILFDLANGGDKTWGSRPPYEALARAACESAGESFSLGSAGAGFGATCANLRGGLGSASEHMPDGLIVGALAAVNPVGAVTIGTTPHFWAAPFEREGEFGGLGFASQPLGASALEPSLKGAALQSTTIAVVATNARLTKSQCHRLAVMAQTGLARAIYPVHSPLDGDVVFALATGCVALDPAQGLARLGSAAANALARAVARGVYEADPAPPGWLGPPAWRTRFGGESG